MAYSGWHRVERCVRLSLAVLVALWSVPGLAWAVELEILGDMTSPHGGFGAYQNLILRSEEIDNAAWVRAGTMTVTADDTTAGLTAPDSSVTADKFAFTGAGVDSLTQTTSGVTAANLDKFTASVWLRTAAGTGNLIVRVEDSTATPEGTQATAALTTTWERFSVTHTATATVTAPLKVILKEAVAADNPTVLVWGAQLEKGTVKPGVYTRTIDDKTASAARDVGFALGKNMHVTGNIEVHGSIITHAGGGTPGDLTTDGNILWKSGTGNVLTFDHGLTAARTVTFPDRAGTVITTGDTGTVTSAMIGSDVANADISATAAIDFSKLAALTAGNILVGNVSNVATGVAMSGDALLSNAGVLTIGTGAVTSGKILDGTILNADVDAGAGIAFSKLAALTSGNLLVGNVSNVATGVAMSGDVAISNAGLTTIQDGAVAFDDLAALTSGNILVGNVSNVAAGVAMSGDAALSNAGALTIGTGAVTTGKILDGTILNADVDAAAAIAGTKISPNFGSQAVSTTGTLAAGATSVSGNLSVRANDNLIMDATDAGGTVNDTYMVHDNANDRIRFYVDGVEVARFKK